MCGVAQWAEECFYASKKKILSEIAIFCFESNLKKLYFLYSLLDLKAYVFQEILNWHSLRNDFEPFFFVLLAPVSLGNKNGCKCQNYDYA